MALSPEQLLKQSQGAYNQWCKQWRENARAHAKYAMKPFRDFECVGVGRAVLAVANGYSLEKEIETIRKYQGNVDIICCDKALGALMSHGITPTYVVMCDANVSYERYLEPWKDKLQDTYLFANVCGNPKWAAGANWKDLYFFTLKDVLGSEREFGALSGCENVLVAGTNVSNAMVIVLTQSDNEARRNFFGYDKVLLIGYDYCWRPGGSYYAFNKDGDGKAHYMRAIYTRNIAGDFVFTSPNLAVSASWLDTYVNSFKLPVVQCSDESVLVLKNKGTLSEQMQYTHRREDSARIRDYIRESAELRQRLQGIQNKMREIGREHHRAFVAST
jgi:hypothetical protein